MKGELVIQPNEGPNNRKSIVCQKNAITRGILAQWRRLKSADPESSRSPKQGENSLP
jgi:hypothetical protein